MEAKITDIQVLDRLKAALVKLSEEFAAALEEADGEVDRTLVWLDREAPLRWQSEVRKRQEEVVACKSALYRKQITPSPNDQKASVVDEKKALQRAIAALEHAEQRLKNVKRWNLELPRAQIAFKGAIQPLAAAAERDLPHAALKVGRMILAIDRYLNAPSPELADLLARSRADLSGLPSMRRTGDEAAAATPASAEEPTP